MAGKGWNTAADWDAAWAAFELSTSPKLHTAITRALAMDRFDCTAHAVKVNKITSLHPGEFEKLVILLTMKTG